MEMMEWVIIFHIFITADIGPLWYCPPFGHCSGSFSTPCSPSMAGASFNPVSRWNDNVYQLSFNKEPGARHTPLCVEMLPEWAWSGAPAEERHGSHGKETGSDRTFVCFTCICYQKPTLTKPSEHACSYTNTLTPQYLVLINFSRDWGWGCLQ